MTKQEKFMNAFELWKSIKLSEFCVNEMGCKGEAVWEGMANYYPSDVLFNWSYKIFDHNNKFIHNYEVTPENIKGIIVKGRRYYNTKSEVQIYIYKP